MSQSIRAAIADLLRNSQSVVALLGDTTLGSSNRSIILAGRLSQGFDTSVPLPCVAVKDSGNLGFPQSLPFFDERFNLYVYDAMPAPNQISYVRIDRILEEVVECINKAQITVNASYYSAFRPMYDNYKSPDSIDMFMQLPYRYARFCCFGAMLRYGER